MSSANFLQLYSAGAPSTEAYLLNQGNVYLFISETDKYSIKGNNLIVGATELILSRLGGISADRLETAVTDRGSTLKKIPTDKFFTSLNNLSFLINVSMVIAKQVSLSNQIIQKNISSLQGNDKKLKEISIEYYRIMSLLKKEYNKRRLPWLNELVQKYETSLLFKRGEALDKTAEPMKISAPIKLSDSTLELEKDAVLCEEGSTGEEMYILQSGTIDVLIKGNRVTSISEAGYVFGEMALLLGEKRSATLKAKNNVVISRVHKSNLKKLATDQSDIVISIAVSLAKKHYYNIEKINTLNTMLIEKNLSQEQREGPYKTIDLQKSTTELMSLKRDVDDVYMVKDADFLKELVASFIPQSQ